MSRFVFHLGWNAKPSLPSSLVVTEKTTKSSPNHRSTWCHNNLGAMFGHLHQCSGKEVCWQSFIHVGIHGRHHQSKPPVQVAILSWVMYDANYRREAAAAAGQTGLVAIISFKKVSVYYLTIHRQHWNLSWKSAFLWAKLYTYTSHLVKYCQTGLRYQFEHARLWWMCMSTPQGMCTYQLAVKSNQDIVSGNYTTCWTCRQCKCLLQALLAV